MNAELKEQRRREKISQSRRRALEIEATFKGASRRAWLALAAAETAMEPHRGDPLVDFALREARAAWDMLTVTNLSAREFLREYGVEVPERPALTTED